MNIRRPFLALATTTVVLTGIAYACHSGLDSQKKQPTPDRLAECTAILRDYVQPSGGNLFSLKGLIGTPATQHSRLLSLADRVETHPDGEVLYTLVAECTWDRSEYGTPFRYCVRIKVESTTPCAVISDVEVILPEL